MTVCELSKECEFLKATGYGDREVQLISEVYTYPISSQVFVGDKSVFLIADFGNNLNKLAQDSNSRKGVAHQK